MSLVGSSFASGWFKGWGELSKPIPWGSRAKNMDQVQHSVEKWSKS